MGQDWETCGLAVAIHMLTVLKRTIMKLRWMRYLAVTAAFAGAAYGQGNRNGPGNQYASELQRNATMVGGGNADHGKCTIEVMVDSAAEVEVRGGSGILRNLSGQPAQWRRFECSSAMPANPPNFNFSGVDGRGRQNLTRDPRNGGVAVVRIEDSNGGSEGYTFDLTWDARGQNYSGGVNNNAPDYARNGNPPLDRNNQPNRPGNDGQYRPNYQGSDYYRRYNHGFGQEEAVRVCQTEVLRQATRRFRGAEVHFDRSTIDDNPGRQDWIIGMIDVHRGQRGEQYRFSCSVNFDNGSVRSAQLEPRPVAGYR
jgi:hypothetical protein